ncbi:hypothetical protein SLS57_005964 [Botryosphaeria dothidea]
MSTANSPGRFGLVVLFLLNSPIVDAYFLNWNANHPRIQPRQTTTSDVAPATTSQSAADRLIENIDRLDESIRDLPNDALKFFNEVGDKIESLESLFGSLIGSSTTSASETAPTYTPPVPSTPLALNYTVNATVSLPSSTAPTPITEPDPIFTILPILESLVPPLTTAATSLPGYGNITSLLAPTAPGSPFAPVISAPNVTTPAFSANVTSVPSYVPSVNSTLELPVFTNTTSPNVANVTSSSIADFTSSALPINVTAIPSYLNATSAPLLTPNATLTGFLAANTSVPVYQTTPPEAPWANSTSAATLHTETFSTTLANTTTTAAPSTLTTIAPPAVSALISNITSVLSLSSYNTTLVAELLSNLTAPTSTPLYHNPGGPIINATASNTTMTLVPATNLLGPLSASLINTTSLAPLSLPTRMPIPIGPLSAARENRTTTTTTTTTSSSESGGAVVLTSAVTSTTTDATGGDVTYVWLSTVTVTTTVVVTPSPGSNGTEARR